MIFNQDAARPPPVDERSKPVDIQKIEGILQDMRAAKVVDLAMVRLWAEQIDEAQVT